MAAHPRSLSIETLESRLNLSSLSGLSAPLSVSQISAQERASWNSRAIFSLGDYLRHNNNNALTTTLSGDRTNSGTTIPAPTSLKATITSSAVSLKWSGQSSSISGYRVFRSSDGVNFAQIATVGRTRTSYNDGSAALGVTYYYYVGAYSSSKVSPASNMVLAKRPAAVTVSAPVAPSALTATALSTSSIGLTWTDNSTNESGYRVYRSNDGVNFAIAANLGIGATSFTDSGLSASNQYFYKVSAWNSGGETFAAVVSGTTLAPAPVITAPSAPANVALSNLTINSFLITWSDATNETGYHVYRSINGGAFGLINTLAAGTTAYADQGLAANTTYSYKIAAFNSAGETASDPVSGTTLTPAPVITAPSAPANLALSNLTTNSVLVTWSDTATNETGYHVYRSTDGVNFTNVANLGIGATSFTDSNLSSSTQYFYKVAAFNSAGETASAPVSGTTLTPAPVITAPSAPANLALSNLTTNSVLVTWSDTATNETGYHVYRSTDGVNFTNVANLGIGATSFTDSNLSSSTQYFYKVAAFNSAGETASAPVSGTTLTPAPVITVPSAPANVALSNLTTNSILITWSDTTNETGYHVYRSINGGAFGLINTLAAGTTAYADQGLAANTTYSYKIAAFNSAGETASDPVSGTTLTPAPVITAPSAPANLALSNLTTNSVLVTWSDTTNETGYHLYRSTDGSTFSLIGSLAAGTTAYADQGLAANTTYSYKIAAFNSAGETASAPVSGATLAPPPPITNPANITTANMTSFTELRITGTSGNDSIYITQSGGILTITANGQTSTIANTFGDLVIHGGGGNDIITVDSSVNIGTLIYADGGSDTIKNLTTGKATIVTIGNGTNTVTGNGINTAYWVNPNDVVNASSAEVALGGVNRISNFYQPWTTNTASTDYISRNLLGQNLRDPTDAGTEIRLTQNSFWGTGATMNDINQTSLADCYYLAPLSSLAYSEPQRLMNMGVDLGDGTYAVRFVRSGVTSYVRVDGDLSAGGWSYGLANQMPGANGNLWGSIFEKAYAFYRSGANTYSSLNYGNQGQTFLDLGVGDASAITSSGATAMLNLINTQLAANKSLAVNTNTTITGGAPLIANHVYSIIGAYTDSSGNVMIRLRNPWGVDGAGNDGVNDGIVTISYNLFSTNLGLIAYTTV